MTTFLGSYERPRRQPLGETSRIGRLVRLSEDTLSAVVELGNEQFELPVSPGKYVLGANVAVLESKGKPRRVSGPAGVWPEGLDADADAPDTVTAVEQLGPRELTEAELQAIQDTADGLADAQADLQDAFERIGNLATEVGFAWSGSFEADYPVGSDFRVDWVALGGGEFRYTMVNIPPGANFGWSFTLPQGGQVFPTTNPAIVTATEAGTLSVFAWADDENMYVDSQYIEVHPAMLDSTGPLQAAIADASAAAVRASRIAPRSRHEPTIEDGDNRPTGAVWTLVNAEGEELAYWAWNGTEWVPQALSTQVIPYLDASHIKTGVLDAGRVNAIEVWAEIATIGRIITSDLLATGAVTSRHLNVVPEEGTGGMELLPPGLRIIPSDAEAGTAVSLRTDEENWLAFAKNGETTFSVNSDGDAVAESVEARQSLIYRGNELADLLNPDHLPRGIIQRYALTVQRGYYYKETGIGYFSFLAVPGRMYKVSVNARLRITEGTAAYIRAKVRHTGSIGAGWPGNLSVNDPELGFALVPINALDSYRSASATFYWTYPNPDLGAEKPTRILFTINALTDGAGVQMGNGTEFVIEDVGLIPEGDFNWHMGGSDGGIPPGSEPTPPTPPPAKRNRTTSWTATGHRTYSYTSLSHVRADQSLVQGAIAGSRSRGHWIFNDTNIRSVLNGADLTSGTLTIRNQHTYGAGGMTAVLRYHNYSTAPSTFGTSTAWTTVHVARGGSATVPLTETILNGLKAGTIRGFSLDAGSSTATSHYGYFSPSASLEINYRK